MTVGLRGKATAIEGVSSTRSVASRGEGERGEHLMPELDRHDTVEAGCLRGGGKRPGLVPALHR